MSIEIEPTESDLKTFTLRESEATMHLFEASSVEQQIGVSESRARIFNVYGAQESIPRN